MIGVLGDQHMRKQARTRESAVDGPRWRRRLHDPVAGVAAQLRPHMTDDLEAGPHILQHLGGIFAKFAEPAAAVGTGFMAGQVRMDFARKMRGQLAAEGLRRCGALCGRNGVRLFDGAGGLQVFELELKLLDLAEDFLALGAEEHPLQLLDQQHEALDLAGARGQSNRVSLTLGLGVVPLREDHRLQRRGIESIQIRQAEGGEHERSMPQKQTGSTQEKPHEHWI